MEGFLYFFPNTAMENTPTDGVESYPRIVQQMGTLQVREVAPDVFMRRWFDRLNGEWSDEVPVIPVKNTRIEKDG